MTVAELIAELLALPQDLPVSTEGCDCIGDAASVEINYTCDDRKPYVLIRR